MSIRETPFFIRRRLTRAASALCVVAALCQQTAAPQTGGCPKWAGDAFFDRSGEALDAAQRQQVVTLAKMVLQRAPQSPICATMYWIVVGHAHPSEGTAAAVEQLSRRRAIYVKQLLAKHGVKSAEICTMAEGARQSAAHLPNWMLARVELEIGCNGGAPTVC